jgi:hypothetical protein
VLICGRIAAHRLEGFPMRPVSFRLPRAYPKLERLEARDVPSFLGATRYVLAGVGQEPVIADFNADGFNDVAVTLWNAGVYQTAVLLGDGKGGLDHLTYYEGALHGRGLLARDLNSDGRLDLAVVNLGSVSVYLGKGDGTFQDPQQFSTGSTGEPGEIAAGDINGDGRLDLATSALNGASGDTMSVLLGNGDGTFQAPKVYTLGTGGAMSVAVGDLDGDGLSDVTVDAYWGDRLYVFYGNGKSDVYTIYVPFGQTQADVNGDGHPDVVAAQLGDKIGVMLNRGDGTLLPATAFQAADEWTKFPIASDLNRDGKLDVVVANDGQGVSTVSWVLGNGDGTFKGYQSTSYGDTGALHVAAGDLNGDGYPDLVLATDSGLSILMNDRKWASGPSRRPLVQHPVTPPPPGPGHSAEYVAHWPAAGVGAVSRGTVPSTGAADGSEAETPAVQAAAADAPPAVRKPAPLASHAGRVLAAPAVDPLALDWL